MKTPLFSPFSMAAEEISTTAPKLKGVRIPPLSDYPRTLSRQDTRASGREYEKFESNRDKVRNWLSGRQNAILTILDLSAIEMVRKYYTGTLGVIDSKKSQTIRDYAFAYFQTWPRPLITPGHKILWKSITDQTAFAPNVSKTSTYYVAFLALNSQQVLSGTTYMRNAQLQDIIQRKAVKPLDEDFLKNARTLQAKIIELDRIHEHMIQLVSPDRPNDVEEQFDILYRKIDSLTVMLRPGDKNNNTVYADYLAIIKWIAKDPSVEEVGGNLQIWTDEIVDFSKNLTFGILGYTEENIFKIRARARYILSEESPFKGIRSYEETVDDELEEIDKYRAIVNYITERQASQTASSSSSKRDRDVDLYPTKTHISEQDIEDIRRRFATGRGETVEKIKLDMLEKLDSYLQYKDAYRRYIDFPMLKVHEFQSFWRIPELLGELWTLIRNSDVYRTRSTEADYNLAATMKEITTFQRSLQKTLTGAKTVLENTKSGGASSSTASNDSRHSGAASSSVVIDRSEPTLGDDSERGDDSEYDSDGDLQSAFNDIPEGILDTTLQSLTENQDNARERITEAQRDRSAASTSRTNGSITVSDDQTLRGGLSRVHVETSEEIGEIQTAILQHTNSKKVKPMQLRTLDNSIQLQDLEDLRQTITTLRDNISTLEEERDSAIKKGTETGDRYNKLVKVAREAEAALKQREMAYTQLDRDFNALRNARLADVSSHDAKVVALTREKGELQLDYEDAVRKLQAAEAEFVKQQSSIKIKENEIETATARIKASEQNVAVLSKEQTQLNDALASEKQKVAEFEGQVAEKNARIAKLTNNLKEAQRVHEEYKRQVATAAGETRKKAQQEAESHDRQLNQVRENLAREQNEIALAIKARDAAKESARTLQTEVDTARGLIAKQSGEIAGLKASIEHFKADASQKSGERDKTRVGYQQAVAEHNDVFMKLTAANAQIEEYVQRNASLQAQIDDKVRELNEQRQQLINERKEAEEKLRENYRGEIQGLINQIQELNTTHGAAMDALQTNFDEQQRKIAEKSRQFEANQSQLQAETQRLNQANEETNTELNNIYERAERLHKQELDNLQGKLLEKEKILNEIEADRETLTEQIRRLQSEVDEANSNYEEATAKIDQLNTQIQQLEVSASDITTIRERQSSSESDTNERVQELIGRMKRLEIDLDDEKTKSKQLITDLRRATAESNEARESLKQQELGLQPRANQPLQTRYTPQELGLYLQSRGLLPAAQSTEVVEFDITNERERHRSIIDQLIILDNSRAFDAMEDYILTSGDIDPSIFVVLDRFSVFVNMVEGATGNRPGVFWKSTNKSNKGIIRDIIDAASSEVDHSHMLDVADFTNLQSVVTSLVERLLRGNYLDTLAANPGDIFTPIKPSPPLKFVVTTTDESLARQREGALPIDDIRPADAEKIFDTNEQLKRDYDFFNIARQYILPVLSQPDKGVYFSLATPDEDNWSLKRAHSSLTQVAHELTSGIVQHLHVRESGRRRRRPTRLSVRKLLSDYVISNTLNNVHRSGILYTGTKDKIQNILVAVVHNGFLSAFDYCLNILRIPRDFTSPLMYAALDSPHFVDLVALRYNCTIALTQSSRSQISTFALQRAFSDKLDFFEQPGRAIQPEVLPRTGDVFSAGVPKSREAYLSAVVNSEEETFKRQRARLRTVSRRRTIVF